VSGWGVPSGVAGDKGGHRHTHSTAQGRAGCPGLSRNRLLGHGKGCILRALA